MTGVGLFRLLLEGLLLERVREEVREVLERLFLLVAIDGLSCVES